MKNQEQTLDERRANCRIWAHMLFWWIVPFGWIISVSKMRYGIPAYVMLGAVCLAVVTTTPSSRLPCTHKSYLSSFQSILPPKSPNSGGL